MSAEKPEIHTIFNEAVALDSKDDRIQYLDKVCGDDLETKARVEALLRAHSEAGGFFGGKSSAFEVTTIDLVTVAPGSKIGPYKLLQQIGEGGMGTVYMAEQTEPVKRKVALKVIKAGMDTRQVIARFEAERQALAMMDHVNIARVFDGGTTENGRPYFVMELVHGVPITKYCDDNHLTPRERLELFVPVCQAIQHAHQKGIIHRDIKPSNVMVTLYDGKPVPKVIDFGVAKATEQKLTERTLFTQYGTMVGTLEYMSPEQAEISALGVDTRSDVFSLGVLLYELLTGSTPLSHKRMKAAAYAEILRLIKEEEAPKPSTRLSDSGDALASISAQRHMEPAKLAKLMRGELDWIVMKTLEKDRNRRYETAKDFAADVQRYLDDEQVQACPPSATYRLGKFARRNKVALLTTLAMALTLIVGAISSVLYAFRAIDAEGLAQTRLGRETIALKAATEAKDDANAARDQAIADAYRALSGETQALREARPTGWRVTAFENLRQLADLKTPERNLTDLRSEAVACLGELDAREIDRFTGHHTHLVYGLHFQPDGHQLATAGYDGNIFLWNLGERRPALELTDHAASPADMWSSKAPLPVVRYRPDGRSLAYTTWNREVKFFSTNDDGKVPSTIASQSQPRDIVFDRQGNRMAVSWGNGQVGIYDAQTGDLKRLIEGADASHRLLHAPGHQPVRGDARHAGRQRTDSILSDRFGGGPAGFRNPRGGYPWAGI